VLRPAGADHTRRAAERVDLQAAVVGDGIGVEALGVLAGFERCIGDEVAAGFFDGLNLFVLGEIIPLEFSVAEHVAKFADFAGIGGRDEYFHGLIIPIDFSTVNRSI
jgi:hypothetical protein